VVCNSPFYGRGCSLGLGGGLVLDGGVSWDGMVRNSSDLRLKSRSRILLLILALLVG